MRKAICPQHGHQTANLNTVPRRVLDILISLIDVRLAPHKRRKRGHFLTAASCQEQTHAPRQMACLIDQLVRDGKQRRRHSETQCLRSLEIDDELKSRGKLYR